MEQLPSQQPEGTSRQPSIPEETPPSQLSSSYEEISISPLTLPQRTSDKSIKEAKKERRALDLCRKALRKHLKECVPCMEKDTKRHPTDIALEWWPFEKFGYMRSQLV